MLASARPIRSKDLFIIGFLFLSAFASPHIRDGFTALAAHTRITATVLLHWAGHIRTLNDINRIRDCRYQYNSRQTYLPERSDWCCGFEHSRSLCNRCPDSVEVMGFGVSHTPMDSSLGRRPARTCRCCHLAEYTCAQKDKFKGSLGLAR